ncbi:MAG: DUF979 domain-containing protein [Finegoldia magna]|uniref:5-oxoproline transporter, DUF979 family subunit n=1 Tax=Finegoldia magna TaxID=1260 RepID=UPI0026ED0A9D|nr:DUF979 family protein [Finegoldia magna]MBS5966459.1 DUF979 domain-containing protein [Finegoldia magna]
MFDFFVDNQVVLDEIAYILCGIICIMTGIRARFNKEAKIGTMLFWILLGVLFAGGGFLVRHVESGGIIVGVILLILGVLSIANQIKPAEFKELTEEERMKNAEKVGGKIFIPALVMGISAMLLSQLKSFKIPLKNTDGIFSLSAAQVLTISSLLALIIAIIIAKPKAKETAEDTTKMLMQVGSSSLLPQLLGGLGVIFASAGVGKLIGSLAAGIVGDAGVFAAAVAYIVGMVVFTMIMGNAFAAFTVITLGIGVPLLMAKGANPAVVASLGMTAGYCGTLITPMAANFNIVPAAILEMKDKNGVIKAQLPVALALVVVHVVLLMILAF